MGRTPGRPVPQKPQEEGFKDIMQDDADRASGERTIKYPLNLLYVNSYLQLPLTFVNRHKGKRGMQIITATSGRFTLQYLPGFVIRCSLCSDILMI